jgi:hypothetical protein
MKRPFTYDKRAFGLLRDYLFIGKESFVVNLVDMKKCRFFRSSLAGGHRFTTPRVTIGI